VLFRSQDILKFTNADPDRIHVIYLGNPFENINHEQSTPGPDVLLFKKPYLLFVGYRSRYKNFNFFIESVAEMLYKNDDFHIVCAGWLPFTDEEKKFLKNLNVFHKVHHIRINDRILKNLYKNARAFIFPSLYEGFGLPVLEAFSCGCPAIISNSSSLPEIGGGGAMYFEPNDRESILHAVETVLFNDNYRDDLIKKGSERLKFFSWEKTAHSTKKVYSNLIYQ
jgi:glycosyltransferase involved in cell wall biosynthesis